MQPDFCHGLLVASAQRHGISLMDLEQGRVVALLPDRSACSFGAWLGAQADVEIISRDRLRSNTPVFSSRPLQ